MDEAAFLRKLLENPADDTVRLVYADWLEEQETDEGRRKSEFLRLEVRALTGTPPKAEISSWRRRLQSLAAELDTDWTAVVSKVGLEACGVQFEFVCPKRWDELFPVEPVESSRARFCTECSREVRYCDTIQEARRHAWAGECVAVDLGVIRRDRDLDLPEAISMGFAPYTASEQERMRPDPVSEARERRKRDAAGG